MAKEISKDSKFTLSLETAATVVITLGMIIGMWFTLQSDIEEAKELPKPEVSKMEFQMKDQMVRDAVLNTEKNVEKLDERMIRMEEKMDQLILR